MKKVRKIFLFLLLAVLILAGGLLGYLTIREYRTADVESAELFSRTSGKEIKAGETISILTWNVGYCALGEYSDFFMDGGGSAPAADEEQVRRYMEGIENTISRQNTDFVLLQEVDASSDRSYRIDEREELRVGNYSYAYNYKCDYVPYPLPPIGKVASGIMTTTSYDIDKADRIALPCPFSWPIRIANLKRCMMASYIPVEGSDKQLVLVNLHLEAYDDGEGRKEQTLKLFTFIEEEFAKGNYVIAGGDWNQAFPGALEAYPNTHEDLWKINEIDTSELDPGWSIISDISVPTCRLLNQPYNPEDTVNTQYYVIDGFIVSPNVSVETFETLSCGFKDSDHNPVRLEVTLLPENG